MVFLISTTRLSSDDGTSLSYDAFKLFTGKDINLCHRQRLEIIRHHGHIHIYDIAWTKDSIYKKDGKEYKCVYTNGPEALLQSLDNKISAISSTEPNEWELIR